MTLKEAIMISQEMTEAEAIQEIADAKEELMERLGNGEMPMDFCEERWNLEPDYLMELM